MNDAVIFNERKTADGSLLGVARLNQPTTLNALSLGMIRKLQKQLEAWENNDAIAAVWLEGEGEKAFCAGGDVVALYRAMTSEDAQKDGDYGRYFFTEEYALDHLIHAYSKPLIAWGSGIIMGGGMGVFVGASRRIVTETSKLAMPEASIGLFPDVGASWFLNRTPGRTGLFAGLTGAHLNAADACYMGLADRFILNDQRSKVLDMLCGSVGLRKDAGGTVDHMLRRFAERSASQMPQSAVRRCHDDIQNLTDGSTLAEVVEQIAGYEGEEPLLQKAAKAVRRNSPLSMQLFWHQLHRARHEHLAKVFSMELRLALQSLSYGEFAEGARAVLIDKDKKPVWRHASVEDVDQETMNHFFGEST